MPGGKQGLNYAVATIRCSPRFIIFVTFTGWQAFGKLYLSVFRTLENGCNERSGAYHIYLCAPTLLSTLSRGRTQMVTSKSVINTAGSASTEANDGGRRFVVLGGGIAGLVAARELLKKGASVVLVEKGKTVGGLARTFEKEGFRFDIGGHRFHSHNPSVVNWLMDLMKDDLLTVPRTSHIYINDRFVDYPIKLPSALSIFPPLTGAKMLVSYLAAKVTERNRPDISFEDWVVKRFGRGLYEVFFEPYTEKVWGIPCAELSATWASQRIGLPSVWRAIKHAISPPKEAPATAISQFYYPRFGFGMISDTLHKEILEMGGTVLTDTSLISCVPKGSDAINVTVESPEHAIKSFEADHVVSTIPLNSLLAAIPSELGSREVLDKYDLEYRDIILLFVAINKKQVSDDSWTYFPLRNLTFGRTHEPKNWSSDMVPDAKYSSLAVEIFSSRGEPVWEMTDEQLIDRVTSEMDSINWVKKKDVHNAWVLRVPYAYPVYRIGYEKKLQAVRQYLAQWPNLSLVGRTGSFHYMNSDGVIEDVFRFMEETFAHDANVKPPTAQVGRWV